MRLRGAVSVWLLGCAVWAAQGCGGEEFSDSQGTGASPGSGGAAGTGGAVSGGSGGAVSGGSGGTVSGGGGGSGGTVTGGSGGTVSGGGSGGTVSGGSGGTGGTTGGAGGVGGSGGLPACGSGVVCAPAVPGGWEGPMAIVDSASATASACGGGYPTEDFVAHNQLTVAPPAPDCTCSCDNTGVTCTNVRIDAYAAAGCTSNCCGGTPCTTVSLGNGACVSSGTSLCSGVTHAAIKADVSKNCAPKLKVGLDNIAWNRTIRGCLPATTTSCSSGTCVPAPGSPTTGRLCVARDGNHACEGAYTQKITAWDTADTRTCSNGCACLQPSCGSLQLYSNANCGTPFGSPNPVPMNCNAGVGTSGVSAKFTATVPPTCTSINNCVPGGDVKQTELSICCLPGG